MPEATWILDFEAYARDLAERSQIPGMAVAVAQHGGARAFGGPACPWP